MSEQKAYVLMAGSHSNYDDGWWEPAGVYTDPAIAQATRDELKRRIPELNVSIHEVPRDVQLVETTAGPLWEIRFGFDNDGSWTWESKPYRLEGDDLAECTGEPYDPYELVATGVGHFPDLVRVLARDVDEARQLGAEFVARFIADEIGQQPRFVSEGSQ